MEELPVKRDFWEKVSLILHSSGGLLTAITVAIISLIGSSYLKDREIKENAYRQETQLRESKNSIYIQLTSNREAAESALRKDMFVSINYRPAAIIGWCQSQANGEKKVVRRQQGGLVQGAAWSKYSSFSYFMLAQNS